MDINQPLGNTMAIRLNGLAQYNEPVGRDYVDTLRFGAAPSFAWGIGTPTLVTASYYYYYENNQPDRGIPIVTFPGQIGGPPDVDPSNYYGIVQQDFEKVHLHRGTITFDHKFNEDIAFHNISRYQWSDREGAVTPGGILLPITAGQPLGSIVVTRNRAGRDESESILANQTEALFKFDTWMLKHKLVGGVDLAHQTYARQTITLTPGPNTSLTNPDPFPPGIFTSTNGVRFEADASSVGAYVVDDIQILSWLKVMAGARYDYFNSDITNFNANGTLARISAVWTSSGRPAPPSSCSPRAHRRTTSPGAGPSIPPPRRSTRSTSPTRASIPRRPIRTSSAPSSASSTTHWA